MLRVIIHGCGISVGVIKSLREREVRKTIGDLKLIGLDSDPLAPGLRLVDSGLVVPRADSEKFNELPKILRELGGGILINLVDEALPKLISMQRDLKRSDVKFIFPPEKSLKKSMDRKILYEILGEEGIPVPETDRLTPPIAIKRRIGRGGSGFRVLEEKSHVPEGYIAMEYLPGREYGVEMLYSKKGELISANPREKIDYRIELGHSVKNVTLRREDLCEIAESAIDAIGGWRGPCSVEMKEDKNGKPKITEINPRFTSPIYLITKAGVNLPLMYVMDCLGMKIELEERHNTCKPGVYQTRYLEEIILPEDQL